MGEGTTATSGKSMADVERVKGSDEGRDSGLNNMLGSVERLTISMEHSIEFSYCVEPVEIGCILEEARVKFGLRLTITGRLRFSILFTSSSKGLMSDVICVATEPLEVTLLDMFVISLLLMPSGVVPFGLLHSEVSKEFVFSKFTPLCRLELLLSSVIFDMEYTLGATFLPFTALLAVSASSVVFSFESPAT